MPKIFVVESDPARFEHWHHPQYGLAAHLRVNKTRVTSVNIERLSNISDLFGLANAVQEQETLPGRGLILQGIEGSDLSQSPHTVFSGRLLAPPEDYQEDRDPQWTYATDEKRPLAPHIRLISSRLVRHSYPSVSFSPDDASNHDYPGGVAGSSNSRELFTWRPKRNGGEKLVPNYARFLQLANGALADKNLDWMSIVDIMGHDLYLAPRLNETEPIEGADITIAEIAPSRLLPKNASKDTAHILKGIGITASLIGGSYPYSTGIYRHARLSLPSVAED